MNPLSRQLISLLSPSIFLWTSSSVLTVQRSTVGDLKRKDVFIEPRPVRCVWSLMSPVTFMWHSIKDGEADKLFNKLTCFGQGVHYDVAAGLQYYGRNLPSGLMWRWVTFSQQRSAQKERMIWATAEGVLYFFFFETLPTGKWSFLSQRGYIALQNSVQKQLSLTYFWSHLLLV